MPKKTNKVPHATSSSHVLLDFVCPITLQLPVHPALAADGRVYEQQALERHIYDHRSSTLKSPLTNQPMADTLRPAPWIKGVIEKLIQGADKPPRNDGDEDTDGQDPHDLIDAYQANCRQEQDKQAILEQARSGDGEAMYDVAMNYYHGYDSFEVDKRLALDYARQAHHAGCVQGTAFLGFLYKLQHQTTLALTYFSQAATLGSDYAAFNLGMAFANGALGLQQDQTEAIRWLQACLDPQACPWHHLKDQDEAMARRKLQEWGATVPRTRNE